MNSILDIFFSYQKEFFLSKKKRKLWLAARQIGKSFTLGGLLVYKALEHGPKGVSLCISTGSRAAAEIIRKAVLFAEAVKVLSNNLVTYHASYDRVQFNNGARVISLPSSTDGANLRGFTAQCVCIDEAAFVWHLDQIMQAIGPALSRDKNAELVLTSTPAGKNGPFYDLYQLAIDSQDIWHVQTTTIHDAIDAGLNVDLASLHTLCPDPDIFAQEYECSFAASSTGMIDLDKLVFEQPDTTGARRVIGIDVGVKSDRSAIAIGVDLGNRLWIEDILVLDKMSFAEQLKTVKQLHAKYSFRAGQIDATGIGYGLSEMITKQVTSLITPLVFTGANKTPMHEQVRADLLQDKMTFSPKVKDIVFNDFRLVQRIVTDQGKIKYTAKKDQTGHADSASAIVLCNDVWHKKPGRASQPDTWMPTSVFS